MGALAALQPGETLVVWKLDRLGRSMLETVKMILDLDLLRCRVPVIDGKLRYEKRLGRGVLALIAAVAEDERERLRGTHQGRAWRPQ